MKTMSAKIKTAVVAGAAVLAGASALVGAPPTAAAAPNDCSQPALYRDGGGAVSNTGTLYHTCSAGTQISYQIDCFISDSYYTHYFETNSSIELHVACPYSKGPLIGLYDYNFS